MTLFTYLIDCLKTPYKITTYQHIDLKKLVNYGYKKYLDFFVHLKIDNKVYL